MTFARPGILRRIPTGPNPAIADYVQLLGPKLRAAFDARKLGEFAPGRWVAHRDLIQGLRVAAPADAQRPLCVVSAGAFRGVPIIRTTFAANNRMCNGNVPNLVLSNALAEVYCIAKLNPYLGSGGLCGCANPNADPNSGAQIWQSAGTTLVGYTGGSLNAIGAVDTAAVHMYSSLLDVGNVKRFLVDGVEFTSAAGAAINSPTSQIAIGGFLTGFTASVEADVAAWGIVSPAMTADERAKFLAIARADWWF